MLAFRQEQSDPDRFYRLIATDTVRLVGEFGDLSGSRVIDVGSGPGDLAEAFRDAGAWTIAADVDFGEMHCRERDLELAVVADGSTLPFRDATFDAAVSSNVLEHVSNPLDLVREMARIVRPGGLVFVNFTAWFSPWGGHETAPWHYLGGERALRRYVRVHGAPPKNCFGSTLFPLRVNEFMRDIRRLDTLEVIDAFPRYFPRWTRGLLKIPGVREVATWNLAVALRRPLVAPSHSEQARSSVASTCESGRDAPLPSCVE
jgi:SAM-dependent methyltransferase